MKIVRNVKKITEKEIIRLKEIKYTIGQRQHTWGEILSINSEIDKCKEILRRLDKER